MSDCQFEHVPMDLRKRILIEIPFAMENGLEIWIMSLGLKRTYSVDLISERGS